ILFFVTICLGRAAHDFHALEQNQIFGVRRERCQRRTAEIVDGRRFDGGRMEGAPFEEHDEAWRTRKRASGDVAHGLGNRHERERQGAEERDQIAPSELTFLANHGVSERRKSALEPASVRNIPKMSCRSWLAKSKNICLRMGSSSAVSSRPR